MRYFPAFLLLFLVLGPWSIVYGPSSAFAVSGPQKTMKQAEAKEQDGDYEGAQALYESILKHHPDYAPAISGLAQVKYWQGDYQGAIDTYAKILKIDSGDIGALIGTGKAYLALGKQRKAQEFFNRAEKLEPEDEEIEAIKPQLEKKTRLELNVGYLTQKMNYASQAQGEYQEVRIVKEKTFSAGVNTLFIEKFDREAFNTRLFGSWNPFEETRISGGLNFAPKTDLYAEIGGQFGLAQDLWKLTAEVNYDFEGYAQATTNTIRPGLFYQPFEFLKLGGGYEYQNLRFANVRRNLNGGFFEARVLPMQNLAIYATYAYIQRGFEAGRRPSPYINYTANVGGGGLIYDFLGGYRLRFDMTYEKRNINEYQATYNLSAGYLF
ncbi:MAG: tetratricopeptide repeat protein [Deltaproteobacteria bacterium]|nr:tetratricopeptide repeat protein [Deltaproteobacteria bacterium]